MPGPSIPRDGEDNRSYYWLVPVVFLATLLAFYRMAQPLMNDNDVPWHLATGTWLLQTHPHRVNMAADKCLGGLRVPALDGVQKGNLARGRAEAGAENGPKTDNGQHACHGCGVNSV